VTPDEQLMFSVIIEEFATQNDAVGAFSEQLGHLHVI
jgi:hypothetical protein